MSGSVKAKHFLIIVLLIVLALCGMYYCVFMYQIGSHVIAEWWLKNVYSYKEHVASSIDTRKVIVAAGSNALFSLDSRVIEQHTGLRVVNLSSHAGLALDFHYYKIGDHIREGDIVVLPLEFNYYNDKGYTEWEANNYMAWGWGDYLTHLSWMELLDFIVNVPKKRLMDGVVKQDGTNPALDRNAVVRQVTEAQSKQGSSQYGYSHLSLNSYGDILVDSPPSDKLLEEYAKGIFYYELTKKPSDYFLESYMKIENIVNAHNGQLILTWPATIRNQEYDLSLVEHQRLNIKLKASLEEHGIEIYCNPALFHLDIDFFHDTMYHTNETGAYIRSVNLGTCLSNILDIPSYEDIDYSIANQIVLKQQARQSQIVQMQKQKVEITKYTNLHKRLQDLKQVREALASYYTEHKVFPISQGFDGLYTKWGKSGEHWIVGLVPDYIQVLPRDPRQSDVPDQQYLYKSDGKAYKLIAHTPEDCNRVSKHYPEMIDPARDCWAYGYWTEGAVDW